VSGPADEDGRRTRLRSILFWQAGIAAAAVIASTASGRGSPLGVAFGAGLMAASLGLQAWATRAALGRRRKPAVAIGAFTLKLALLIGAAAIGLSSGGIPPMSFAAGATTLLLAIVVETCYADWSLRHR
jgi:hypothetical protein